MNALISARNTHKGSLFLTLCFLMIPIMVFAQGEASISGTVTDTTGGAIPGTSITVKNLETGLVRNLIAGDNGRYDAPLLPVGQYEVAADLAGFQSSKRQVTLVVGARLALDFTLKVQEL